MEIPKNGAAVEGKRQPQPLAEAAAKDRPVLSRAAERDISLPKSAGTLESGETAGPPARPKESGEKPEQIQFDKKRFIWPVKGTVVSPFGIQSNRMYFNGIRIAAGEGTPVQAAADGVVIFSAPLKDYGETIIIQHEDHYATVYAHLGIRTVQGEVRVKKGGRIAFIGKAAAKEEASLHFEIRQNNKARNPLFFLP
jgi:murein DD-endopeptidase MepM/ murein hydrolase activator NlpD